ncbi:MAG: isoaspartyl peptidase/L-asparaginase [Pseudomonadota bacterium]
MNMNKRLSLAVLGITSLLASPISFAQAATEVPEVGTSPEWVIAIHGGAGDAKRASLTPEQVAKSRADLTAALEAGAKLLDAGGTGPEAIEAALKILEDSPDFNAGRGAALDEHGDAKHDASIMRGEDHAAGGVAGSSRIKNPIAAARAVMEQTQNVLLHGEGADWFAADIGLEMANPHYFITEGREAALRRMRAFEHGDTNLGAPDNAYYGTVGAVVLDKHGNISAGTTTGGRTNKRYGRIGDTPIIGSGTYASNQSCAVSATGHGEFFMRWTVARDICARVEFADETLARSAEIMLADTLLPKGGTGGIIAMEPDGSVVFVATTANMRRGVMSSETPARVAVYTDEEVE